MTKSPHYPNVSPNPDFAALEQEILDFWHENDIFVQSVAQRSARNPDGSSNAYVFYDGPPFANGLPHYGHLLTGYVKDAIARYHTMRGKRVERRFGWDCHGLPAEMGAEKELGISGRAAITNYGIGKFNEYCRTSVMKYTKEWEYYVTRQGRWVDFKNDYKTMDTPYMESVIWAFSELYKKGLIYESMRVMPYSWAAETPVSNFETRLDNATREREDKAAYVRFKLKEKPKGAPDAENYYLVAWTTTPWTLPSNLALAVNTEMEYACIVTEREAGASPAGGGSDLSLQIRGGGYKLGEGADTTRDPVMLARAQAMRGDPTEAEKKLWYVLSGKKLGDRKFRRQHAIGNYIVDFVCTTANLIIELDGGQHADHVKYDAKRTAYLNQQHYRVIRFWNHEVLENLEGVVEVIASELGHPPEIARAISTPRQRGVASCTFVAQSAATKLAESVKGEVVGALKGNAFLNLTYEPLFPYFADAQNAFRVLDGSAFVTDGDGTGIVHMAPGFGEVDQQCCAENGIEVVVPVDEKGRFTNEIYDLPRSGAITITPGKIETARCVLRPFTPEDADRLIALHTHPAVTATSNDGVQTEAQVRDDFAQYIAHQEARGYSQWAVFLKDGTFIGRCGLTHSAQSTEVEPEATLRCALLPEYWHGGYGQECCRGAMQYGFEQCGVDRIAAGSFDNNPRAHTMLQNLGFRYIRHVRYPARQGAYYLVTREEFARHALPLHLRGLNVIAERSLTEEDKTQHISEKDVEKFGLANMRIVRWLKAQNKLVKDEVFKHNYPHCWRTDTPLIYRAMASWYVDVPKIKHVMAENNRTIRWIPEHVRDGQMGHMIDTAPGWSISRNRFWGTPIPIWRSPSGKIIVPGSIAEIEELSGKKVEDLHRPMIDDIVITKDGEEYRRIEDVFDCWFESGSMPYAQLHYPFENKERFEREFPADFITEYIAQTRGWFNTLITLSAALFGKAPFKNVICHGVVLDEETGEKYSKRLKNYKDPKEVMDAYGADALRWMMLASPVMRGADLAVDPDGKFIRDVVRLNIKPIWSAYNFFTLYANADGIIANLSACHPRAGGDPALRDSNAADAASGWIPACAGMTSLASENLLDRYILAKCKAAIQQVQTSLDAYDTPGATEAITAFFEVLNNWYIRRSRARFWGAQVTPDKQAAYDTLFTVLNLMCIAAAPLLPFTTEAIYRGLNGNKGSADRGAERAAGSVVPSPLRGGLGRGDSDSSQPNPRPPTEIPFPAVVTIPKTKQGDFDSPAGGEWEQAPLSVHLADFPDISWIDSASQLIADMDRVRDACTAMAAIRSAENIRNRQPLASATFYGAGADRLRGFAEVMMDELNIKDVRFSDSLAGVAEFTLTIDFKVAGKRLGGKMKEVGAAAKARKWRRDGDRIIVGDEVMQDGEYNLHLKPLVAKGAQRLSTNDALVVLDLNITPELEAEGRARDLVRMIQQARKDGGFDVSDRVALALELPEDFKAALATHRDYIAEQTLAISIADAGASGAEKQLTQELDGAQFTIGITKAAA